MIEPGASSSAAIYFNGAEGSIPHQSAARGGAGGVQIATIRRCPTPRKAAHIPSKLSIPAGERRALERVERSVGRA